MSDAPQPAPQSLTPASVDAPASPLRFQLPVELKPSGRRRSKPVPQTFAWGQGTTSFYGFPPERPPLLLSDVQVVDGPDPDILEFEDLVVLPYQQCLYTPDGRRVEATKATFIDPDIATTPAFQEKFGRYEQARSPAQMAIPDKLEVWDDPVVLLGRLHSHFGHFLTDSQARTWAMLKHGAAWSGLKVLFTPVAPEDLGYGFVQDFLRELGIAPERVWTSRTPTLMRRVICPMPTIHLSRRIYSGFDRPHRAVAERLLDPSLVPDHPVYLSRRGLGSRHRAIEGEDRLEARLEREGYRIVRPETLSLRAQVSLFNGDHPVVGVIGSALHNALFRLGPSVGRLGVITDGAKSPRFHLVDAVKPLHTSYIQGLDLSQDTPAMATKLQDRAYALDVERTLDHLSEASMLRR